MIASSVMSEPLNNNQCKNDAKAESENLVDKDSGQRRHGTDGGGRSDGWGCGTGAILPTEENFRRRL